MTIAGRFRGAMRTAAVLATVACASSAFAAAPIPALEPARQRIQTADFRATGHLVRVDSAGKRTSYAVNLAGHWFPGVLRVRVDISAPAEARTHLLLEMHPGGETTIRIAHPGDHAARLLPPEAWSGGPLGAVFSYEDFLDAHYFWAGQTLIGQPKYGARDCDLVRSTPGPADRSEYSEVRSWLDRTIGFPVHVEKTTRKSGEVKEFTYFGLRKNEGVWSASQVEVKVHGQGGSTLLIIDRGTPHAHLALKDFRPEELVVF